MLLNDYKKSSSKTNIMDLWNSNESTLAGKLLNSFVKEQYWLYFVIGSWDDLNKTFKRVVEVSNYKYL